MRSSNRFSNRLSVSSLSLSTTTVLGLCLALGCSSSSTSPPKDAGTAGVDGGAAGHDAGGLDGAAGGGGADAAAGGGQVADGSTADTSDAASDTAPGDAASDVNLDALLSDISSDVVTTDGPKSLTLSSAMLAEGAAFGETNTCAGANKSPALTWTAGPAGTMSYAVVLTDLSIDAVHWVIWDLPAGTTSLPAGLPADTALTTPAGAKQVHKVEFFGAGGAYRGPCPRGANHVYQLEVDAIGSATLAGVGATPTTDGVKAAVQAASLAHGDLEGTSNATPPTTDAGGQ